MAVNTLNLAAGGEGLYLFCVYFNTVLPRARSWGGTCTIHRMMNGSVSESSLEVAENGQEALAMRFDRLSFLSSPARSGRFPGPVAKRVGCNILYVSEYECVWRNKAPSPPHLRSSPHFTLLLEDYLPF